MTREISVHGLHLHLLATGAPLITFNALIKVQIVSVGFSIHIYDSENTSVVCLVGRFFLKLYISVKTADKGKQKGAQGKG